jgi:iron complex outermembrane receptor protein
MKTLHTLALALGCSSALAQTSPSVLITGNPLGRQSAAQAASVLTGDALLQRRAGTLGETLDGLTGVAGSGFGPNSNRPVIRGLDGDRVRLLDNGGVSSDASNLSFDHAVAVDPLVIERLEVLRGPAALLYGGNATGGVINAIDNRIPRAPAKGLTARLEARAGGAAHERAGALVLDGGGGGFGWHADAFGRQAGDLRTPAYTPVEDGQPLDPSDRVRNSAARSSGGALGAGWVARQGYLGISAETLDNRYGVTVEPDVFIRLKRDRVAVAGELRDLSGALRQVSLQASHTRYQHEEVEGSGEVGTTFKSRGNELRAELRHAPLGPLQGVVGLQSENLRFSALGAEAFVPGTRTQSNALFVLEELSLGATVLSAGARTERVKVRSEGDAADADEPRFGAPASRRFTPLSLSLGATHDLGAGWQAQATLGSTERAPAYYELYANGVHVATAAYERGDPNLALERSRHVEAGLAWRSGAHTFKASVFSTHFMRYIALEATGLDVRVPGEDGEPDSQVPAYAFRSVRARLTGLELEARAALPLAGLPLAVSLTLDGVRGNNRDTGEPLPRLAPLRASATLEADFERWRTGLTVRHAARQNRVPAYDTATPGHTLVDLWATGRLGNAAAWQWFARLANAGDRLATNATAVSTVRGLTPQGGRALTLGLRWQM